MRIVYLAESEIPSRAANSVHVMKMCSAFANLGHDVHLVVPRTSRESNEQASFTFYGVAKNFRIHRLVRRNVPGMRTWFALKCAYVARRLRPDLAYGRFLHACWAAVQLGLEVVYESHAPESDVSAQSARLVRRLIRSPRLKRLVVISHALKQHYLREFPAVAEKIVVIPDAADEVVSNVTPVDLHALNGRLQVGYVGHLYRGKGMELISALAPRCTWADFHIVGGTEEDLAAWRSRLSNSGNVHVHGFIAPGEADRYRLAFDVALAPYQRSVHGHGSAQDIGEWMSPLKIFEYMAARRPIIASDLPVLREILQHGETALLCPPDDVDAWAQALARLRDSAELRVRLGQTAYDQFQKHYMWRRRAERILAMTAATPQ
ncbi:MAG: glycosyltransferase family 4 protein [Candidatus Hydrogenedentales bacterium]